MTPYRFLLKYKFILVFAAVILMSMGLALFVSLVSVLPGTAQGEKNGRNASAAEFALSGNATLILPTVTQQATPSGTPTSTATPSIMVPEASRGLLTNGDRNTYKIALTFDVCQADGDLAGYDREIVRILDRTQTPATFFLGGLWMRDHQSETHELASNPLFELGNHSWSHEDFSTLSREEMEQEVVMTQEMMYDLLGYRTNLFRLPYGTYNEEALNLINEEGLYIIQWDDVSGDPDPDINAKSMTRWVLQQVQPGSIIIMHANGRGWHTAEALPRIIDALHEQGYTLVTVSDLLQIPPYK